MDISEYQAPKILFIKNVFVRDCILMDDLMEQKLMDEANETAVTKQIDDKYIKLPTIFTDIAIWPKTTDILCWYCDKTFTGIPVFIPKNIEPNPNIPKKYMVSVEGCFCSFNCAMAHINSIGRSNEKINKIGMLKLLFKEFYGISPKDIIASPSRFKMIQYGGNMTSCEYSSIIKDLQRKSGI